VLDGMKLEDMPSEIPHMRVLVSLPPTYPNSAPQLQLLGRYMGSFGIDAGLCKSFSIRSLYSFLHFTIRVSVFVLSIC
jgi:hypothetical protein